MPKDTDGTNWATVTLTVEVQVMADNEDDAIYFARLSLPDVSPDNFSIVEVEL